MALLIVVSLAFAWIVWPFFGAVFWATVLAIVFAPVFRHVSTALGRRRTIAALVTVLLILVLVILPSAIIAGMLVQEGLGVYQRVRSGDLDVAQFASRILATLPDWASGLAERLDIANLASLQERLAGGLMRSLQYLGTHAVNVGQYTLDFVAGFFIMLYLLFFLLRDGQALATRISDALPLDRELQHQLAVKFKAVIRATVKGNVVIAIAQGALGGIAFWFLDIHAAVFWAVVMALLSLLPAIGAALVWIPVAIYLLATGAVWQGIGLTAYGVLVIGLVDNVLRPVLVGADTRMPDYVVLISTLGAMAIFGIEGFVIGPVIAAMFIAIWDAAAERRS
ncbi:MAG TPA: AI-2E family transporter [Casimicrobiaceae bacterium]|nr:AI-2E family transporter [Casimicrobiaceae bacterium]